MMMIVMLIMIRVVLALNTRKTDHWQRKGGGVKCAPRATSLSVNYCHVLPLLKKVALPFPFFMMMTVMIIIIIIDDNDDNRDDDNDCDIDGDDDNPKVYLIYYCQECKLQLQS